MNKKDDNIIYFKYGKLTPLVYRLKKWALFIAIVATVVIVFITANVWTSVSESKQSGEIAQQVVTFLQNDTAFLEKIGGEFEVRQDPYVSVFRKGNKISSASCKVMIFVDNKPLWVTCNLDQELNIKEVVVSSTEN